MDSKSQKENGIMGGCENVATATTAAQMWVARLLTFALSSENIATLSNPPDKHFPLR
jgi:hypothetical protein